MSRDRYSISDLEGEEQTLVLESFSADDAWVRESLPRSPSPDSRSRTITLLPWTHCVSTAAANGGSLERCPRTSPPPSLLRRRSLQRPQVRAGMVLGPGHGQRSARATGR